jgi:hypothetical protein
VLRYEHILKENGLEKSIVFRDIMLCSPLKVNGRFGGTYSLHLQGQRIAEQETSTKTGGKQS